MGKRKSIGTSQSMCVQPTFIIGTYDEEGKPDFAPITWLSVTNNGERFLLVISMFGTKKTKLNVQKTKLHSANLASVDMLPLVDYLGTTSGHKGVKNDMDYAISEGEVLKVPTLDASRWVYELEVVRTVTCGESDTFFCEIRNIQIDENIDVADGIDLTKFDPVIYSGHYHSLDKHLGRIGDFICNEQD